MGQFMVISSVLHHVNLILKGYVQFSSNVKVNDSHIEVVIEFFFGGDAVYKARVNLGKVSYGFCLPNAKSVHFKKDFLLAKPADQLTWFGVLR